MRISVGWVSPGFHPSHRRSRNAIFAATGIRVRELPIKNHDLSRTVRQASRSLHTPGHSIQEGQDRLASAHD